MDARHPKWIDLNSKAGDSFWGLTRTQAKSVAMVLIISSLFLMTPPGMPDPSDIINIAMGKWIMNYFNISPHIALALTYTLIPWTIFLIGIWIYPARTMTIFNGYVSKLKFYIKQLFRKPFKLMLFMLIGIVIFNYYLKLLGG